MRKLGLFLVVTVLLGLVPQAAVAEADRFATCKDGGWRTATGADGRRFDNQGQCVGYVAQGGTVTPSVLSWLGPQPSTPPEGAPTSYRLCDARADVHVDGVRLTSQSPVGVAIEGRSSESITNGTLSYHLSFSGIRLADGDLPLSSVMSLPLAAGEPFVLRADFAEWAPEGSYTLQVTMTSDGPDPLLCVALDLSVL